MIIKRMVLLSRTIEMKKRQLSAGAVAGIFLLLAALVLFLPQNLYSQEVTCYSKAACDQVGGDFVEDERCKGGDALCYAPAPNINLTIRIGETPLVRDIGDYISAVYRYAVGIASVIAAVMMMIGGLQWLTAGGSTDRVGLAKKRISNALVGLALALGAYLILNTINPALVKLRLPRVPLIRKVVFAGCAATELCIPCGVEYGIVAGPKGELPEQGKCKEAGETKDGPGVTKNLKAAGVVATCVGRGCKKAASSCSDAAYRCREAQEGETSDCSAAAPKKTADGKTYACKSCRADGADCAPNGRNDHCCGGYCAKGKCTAGQTGDPCKDNADCVTGLCETNFQIFGVGWGACSLGEVGSPCSNNKECKAGYKCGTRGHNVCTPGTQFSWCANDDECQQGLRCDTESYTCQPPNLGAVKCKTDQDCTSYAPGELRVAHLYCTKGICSDGSVGSPCSEKGQCSFACIENRSVCTDGKVGSLCLDKIDCINGHCFQSGEAGGVCVSGEIGSRCDGPDDCGSDFKCPTDQTGKGRCLDQ